MTTQMQMGATQRPQDASPRHMQAEEAPRQRQDDDRAQDRPRPQMGGIVFDDWAAI